MCARLVSPAQSEAPDGRTTERTRDADSQTDARAGRGVDARGHPSGGRADRRGRQLAPAGAGRGGPSLFEARALSYAGGFVAATVAMAPLDRAIARRLQDSTLQASRFLK